MKMVPTFKMKNFFFDRKVVIDHFGRKGSNTLRGLKRFGAFLRTRARSLLRRRKRIAKAGEPASIHTSDSTITLKNIQFAYDIASESLVVGTVLTSNSRRLPIPVPQLLEHGGTVAIKGKTKRYAKHGWMAPALEAERGNLPKQFQVDAK